MQHTGTHQREGTRSHALPIAQRCACAPGRIVSLTRRGDKNGDGAIAPTEFDTANLAYDSLGRVTQCITDAWYPAQFTYNALDRVIRNQGWARFLCPRVKINLNP